MAAHMLAPSSGLGKVTIVRLLPALALLLAACSGFGTPANPASPAFPGSNAARSHAASSPIKHVIFIIQENRSFNNLFRGFPGAKTQNYGYDMNGAKITLQAIHLSTNWDIDHSAYAFFAACDGQGPLPGTKCKMDGWNNESAGYGAPKNFAYAYVPKSEITPYWSMASQYVLADRMFASNLDGSFVSHQYAIAAFASHAVDYPQGPWGCSGAPSDTVITLTDQRTYGTHIDPCFQNPTIGSEADGAGISWRFYTGSVNGDGGLWSAYQAAKNICQEQNGNCQGPDWKDDVVNPPSQFLTDIRNGKLANVTWITPAYENSDHPGFDATGGPAWVTSVVDAVGASPFWKSSAIFLMWDDPGGWFDPVKPPFKDYDGLGFRVPLIIISPYAKQGYVTHFQYETASVLRFMEDTFGLGQLAPSDKRARDPVGDTLDYSQAPRKFKMIQGSKPNAYWIERDRTSTLHAPPKAMIGDD